MRIFNWDLYILTATTFQVGSATVFLFLNFNGWFKAQMIQSVVPVEKFSQAVYHKIYTTWWLPYWLSAFLLKGFCE